MKAFAGMGERLNELGFEELSILTGVWMSFEGIPKLSVKYIKRKIVNKYFFVFVLQVLRQPGDCTVSVQHVSCSISDHGVKLRS